MRRGFALGLVEVMLLAQAAYACNCNGLTESPCRSDEVVFLGLAHPGADPASRGYLTFSVTEVLRGTPPSLPEIWTNIGCCSCPFDFKAGETYLVFASDYGDGRLAANTCGLTRHIRDAAAVLAQLRSLAARGSSASVFGTLEKYMGGPGVKKRLGHFAGLEIRAVSDKGAYRTVTAADGTYEFRDLPAGLYEFTPDLPDTWVLAHTSPPGAYAEANSCWEIPLHAYPTNEISGRIIDSFGKAARGYALLVLTAGHSDSESDSGFRLSAELDKEGSFFFGNLAPGNYKLSHIEKAWDSSVPATFFPGVSSFEEAGQITLEEGRPVEGLVFYLPATVSPASP